MFEILVPITKAVSSKGKLLIEGIASGPIIDSDFERFDIDAINKMKDTVNSGGLPIRVEHENKFYTEIGVWTMADINKDNQLIVKGEVNTNLSLGNDLKIKILEEKQPVALSVGGNVLKFVNEFCAELGRNIKVYKDVILDEISIVKNPAYPDASLSISKSADKKISAVNGVMKKVSCEEFDRLVKCKMIVKSDTKLTNWADNVYSKIEKHITKYYDECCEDTGRNEYVLTVDDLKIIPKIVYILNTVSLPEDNYTPEILQYDNNGNNDYYNSISEDCYIILSDRRKLMPHHNFDFSLNKELVLYQLKQLIDGNAYLTTDGYIIALSHLYQHLRQLSINDEATEKKQVIDSKYLEVMEKSYSYLKNGVGEIPSIDGNQLNYATLKKCAVCYQILNDNNNKLNFDTMPKKEIKKSSDIEEVVVESTVKTTEELVDKVSDEKETEIKETEATEVVEEVSVEKNKEEETKEEEVEDSVEKLKKSLVEDEKEIEEEKIEEPADETNEDFVKSVADLKKSIGSLGDKVEEKIMKSVDKSLSKVLDGLDTIAKSVIKESEKSKEIAKGFNDLKENQDKLSEIVDVLAKNSMGRKSVATYSIINKSEESQDSETKIKELINKGMSFPQAYAQIKNEELN